MLASHLGNVTLAGLGALGEDGQLYKGHQIVLDLKTNTWTINDSYGLEMGRGFPTLAAAHRFIDMHWDDPENRAATDMATQEMLIRTRALEVGDDPDRAVAEWKSALNQSRTSTTDTGLVTGAITAASSGISSVFSGIKNLFSSPATPVPTAPVTPTGMTAPATPLPTAGAVRIPTTEPNQLPVQGPAPTIVFNEGPTLSKQLMPFVLIGAMGLAGLYVMSTSGSKKAPARRRRKTTSKKRRRKTSSRRRR